jgi:phosphatidylserine/phosphatidylglycerophosphate/cardiolipin synthase-like enzyme
MSGGREGGDGALAPIGIGQAAGRLVPDEAYLPFLAEMVNGARRRCLATVFIVDASSGSDSALLVDGLLLAFAEAAWRGVDARLVIGGSRTNRKMIEMAETARKRAGSLALPCRWLTSAANRGSHAKLVIADDRVLVGSHNWSAGAFTGQTQDSVCVSSPALARVLGDQFEGQWRKADNRVSV